MVISHLTIKQGALEQGGEGYISERLVFPAVVFIVLYCENSGRSGRERYQNVFSFSFIWSILLRSSHGGT